MPEQHSASGDLPELQRLELQKHELECEKLRLEIERMDFAWWKRPGYIGSLVPIVIALAGLISAWATGYFNTEREILNNEIKTLTLTRDDLEEAKDEIQQHIDNVYVQLKFISFEASYAIGHLRFYLDDESLSGIEAALEGMPVDAARAVRTVLERQNLTKEIVQSTESDLADLRSSVETIRASDWVHKLSPNPKGIDGSNRRLMSAPDGRYYDIDEKRFDERNEFSEEPGSGR